MPERIYLFDYNEALTTPLEGDTVYIRKDIVDEMIKTAEDHAYFAGSEYARKELIEKACQYIREHRFMSIPKTMVLQGGYLSVLLKISRNI